MMGGFGGGGFGGGGFGGGGFQPRGGGKGGGKERRRNAQQQQVAKKSGEETDYYWRSRQKFLSAGGRQPKSEEYLRKAERELFAQHTGVVGINFNQYESIPVECSGPGTEQSKALGSFAELGASLPPFLSHAVGLMKYANPTPIQRNAIPHSLLGKDLMCCAQTGSGKTCAFLLPVTASLGGKACCECGLWAVGRPDPNDGQFYCDRCWDQLEGVEMGPTAAYAVVMAPTRELALQIHLEARKLTHGSDIHPVVVYGGAPARGQLDELALGGQILVATPGRLIDFVDRGVVTLSSTRFLVLDEADRMLDMGFEPQIRQIVQKRDMPPKTQRQTLMFSATFPGPIQKLAAEFMNQYVWIAVGRVGSSVESIQQVIVQAPNDKRQKLALAAQAMQAVEGRTLVFVQKKATADWVCRQLHREYGVKADAIHGDRNQSQREGVLDAFRKGKIMIMVATDVAARGLDIPEVRHVVNFDLPTSPEEFDSYVHRIGRTGRAGHTGKATGLYVQGMDPKTGNGRIAKQLLQMLQESSSEVPDWFLNLPELSGQSGGGGGGGGGGKGGQKFGGRDVRGNGTMHHQSNGGGLNQAMGAPMNGQMNAQQIQMQILQTQMQMQAYQQQLQQMKGGNGMAGVPNMGGGFGDGQGMMQDMGGASLLGAGPGGGGGGGSGRSGGGGGRRPRGGGRR